MILVEFNDLGGIHHGKSEHDFDPICVQSHRRGAETRIMSRCVPNQGGPGKESKNITEPSHWGFWSFASFPRVPRPCAANPSSATSRASGLPVTSRRFGS